MKATTLILSDLHLGAEAALDDFCADDEFADFLAYYGARNERLHLVLNGDFIDFLQIDPYPEKRNRREDLEEIFPLRMTEDQAVAALERTMARHERFFAALRELLGDPASTRTRRITILRGNHDIELAFPGVQARLRAALGAPSAERLVFPPVCFWDRGTGLYVEHGCQYDPWNTFAHFEDPFLDKERRKLETPFGSVVVKTFWNRMEREFPYIDKIRPMADSLAALLVQRPTYLLVKFDYFVDLMLAAWAESVRTLLARRPPRPLAPPEGTPEATARKLWRRVYVGRLTGLVIFAITVHLAISGSVEWLASDAHGLRGFVQVLRALFERFALHTAAAAAGIALARLLRWILWKRRARAIVRVLAYRLFVLAAAAVFFEAVGRMFWLPIVVAIGAYLAWDGVRTLRGARATEQQPLPGEPPSGEAAAAHALLARPEVRTVVFGHTHAPIDAEVTEGKRFINSGTWVKVVDVRNVRIEPVESNTFVLVEESGEARLMCWRGTEPARRYVKGARPQLPLG